MRRMITIAAMTALLPGLAHSQAMCADRAHVTERLENKYGEEFSGGGLRNAGAVFEVWTAGENGSWTILMTRPDGKSCIMASGTNWRDALPQEKIAGIPG